MKQIARILVATTLLLMWSSLLYAKQYVVAFPQDNLANDYRLAQVREVEAAFKAYPNITFVYSDARGDTARLMRNIEDHVLAGVDLLMVSPGNAQLVAPLISKLHRRGLPVVLVDREVDTQDYTTLIHPDNRVIARKAARYLAKKLNNKGSILMLRGVPHASVTIDRTEAFLEAIKAYPGIRVVRRTANFLRADAIRVMEDLYNNRVEFNAIYSQSDSMLGGVRLVMKARGLDPSAVLMVGIDYITEAKQAILNGTQDASFTYSLCGKEAVAAAVRILSGEVVPKEINIDSVVVTKENANQVSPIF